MDGLLRIWTVVGPVVAGLLGAGLTAHHQRSTEERRIVAAVAAEQRHANRDAYLDLLRFAIEVKNDFRKEAILSFIIAQPGEDQSRTVKEKFELQMRLMAHATELDARALLVRSTGSSRVAKEIDKLSRCLFESPQEMDPLDPISWLRTMESFHGLENADRSRAVYARILEIEAAISGIRSAVSTALTTP